MHKSPRAVGKEEHVSRQQLTDIRIRKSEYIVAAVGNECPVINICQTLAIKLRRLTAEPCLLEHILHETAAIEADACLAMLVAIRKTPAGCPLCRRVDMFAAPDIRNMRRRIRTYFTY